MKKFSFSLHKALDWRRRQLELEQARMGLFVGELNRIESAISTCADDRLQAQKLIRGETEIAGRELAALNDFADSMSDRIESLNRDRARSRERVEQQRAQVMEANRRVRLLEKLREARLREWTQGRDRELEELAAESFLANWQRRERRSEVN